MPQPSRAGVLPPATVNQDSDALPESAKNKKRQTTIQSSA
jgi:predicted small lipoprotein YifL